MTTATDTWDATWKDTGEHPVVHEDATRLPDDAPVMAMEDVHALAQRNAELTDLVHRLTDDKGAAYADVERLSAELDTLREQVGPLDSRWTPPVEQPTAWIEEREIARRAATHRPSADTHTYIADLHRQDRQRWDSVHDDIEALTAHEPADVWDDELRALLQPVETDWWEREDRLMVGLVTREQESVYAELSPERIQAESAPQPAAPPPSSAANAKVLAPLAVKPAVPATTPRRPWWRRHADVIAGVAIGAGLFAALGVAYVTGVLT